MFKEHFGRNLLKQPGIPLKSTTHSPFYVLTPCLKQSLPFFVQSLSKSQKSTSEDDLSKKGDETVVDAKDRLKCSTLPSSKNRPRSSGVGRSDETDETDEMMDMLVKTVTSKKKSRVRRRERSSTANRKSRRSFLICFLFFFLFL